jgi:hypothetical protein
MANSKISALTSASTVVGTEVLPIVQTSATVKLAISDLNPGLSTILATKGGTGQTSYAVGDLLYASTTTTLAKLADVATGNALISGGVSTAPSYGKIGLTTHVSGVLPVANGGTNASTASITSFNNITGYTASGATGTTSTDLVFSTSPSITTPTLVGDATLSTGNLVIGTSGKGIDFSATPGTGTSELLDDYEEGLWTPTLITDGTQFTSVTYDTLVTNGRYTKIGNAVHIQGSLRTDAVTVGSASGSVCIGGLPYTVTASTSGTQNGISAISIGVASAWAGEEPLSAVTVANATRFELYYRATVDGNTVNTAVADVDTGADKNVVRFSGTYIST